MKTIEERANEYIGHPFEMDENVAITMARDSYIKGATEQKAIDDDHFREATKKIIEKACEWLKENMPMEYDVEHGEEYEAINIDDFRKAMEE